MNALNIMIVGVGGQGTLLASRILGAGFISQGLDVKVSEVHGMSQRGGSVVTYVRCADKVYSPLIEQGEADMIIAFELLEGARWLPYLKKGGKLIVNTQQIDPMPVITGAAEYPQGILEKLADKNIDVVALDALSLAIEAGSKKAVNVVLLGVAAKYLEPDRQVWLDALANTVPPKFLEMNQKAFELAYNR